MDKEILMQLLATRKKPKVEIEKIEVEPNEEDEKSTTGAPKGKLIEEGEEVEEMEDGEELSEMPEQEGEEPSEDLLAEMLGGMQPEQIGDSPKSLRERAIVEMMKRKAQKAV